MCSFLRAALLAAAIASPLLATSDAAADLPPPDGEKYVEFAVVIENLAAFPDMVVVAYPWSMSSGAPTTEHARAEDGKPLGVGRRSPQPKLWAIAKADYEAFSATYKATHSYEDPALEALFKSDKVKECNAVVTPSHQLPESDPRDTIIQSFRAEAVAKDACRMVAIAAKPGEAGATSDGVPGAPGSATPPSGGGCAACTTSAQARTGGVEKHAGFAAVLTFAVGVSLVLRRRR
jgi:hypothetical protein